MKRLNLTVDEELYEKTRRASFMTRRSISEILRDAMSEWLINHPFNKKGEIVLSSEDEAEILGILESDEFLDLEEAKRELGFQEIEE